MIDTLMVLMVLMNLRLLASSRLKACINTVAIEGISLGLLPVLLVGSEHRSGLLIGVAAISVLTRGIIFPRLLLRGLRAADQRREARPTVSYPLSILAGVLALVLSVWVANKLPHAARSVLMAPVALSTILTGLFVIVSRRLTTSQVLGYLVMENGIYILGLAMVQTVPLLVELGVLMDAFVAVFVMSMATYSLSHVLDHADTDQLDTLKD